MVAGDGNDLPYNALVCCGLPFVLCGQVFVVGG